MHFGRNWLDGDTQRVLGLLITEAAPGSIRLREDHGPLVLTRNHVETVGPGEKRLAFDRHRISKGDGCILIGAGAPDLSVRHKAAPDFAAIRQWTVIADGYVRCTDALNDFRVLARPWQIQQRGLRVAECGKQKQAGNGRQFESLHMQLLLADVLEVPQSNRRIRVCGLPHNHLRTVGRGPVEAVSAKGRVARPRLRSTSERDETKGVF